MPVRLWFDFTARHRLLSRLAAPAVMLTLWLLSSRSTLPMPANIFGLDKLAHFVAYGILALTLGLWFPQRHWREAPLRTMLLIITIASVYGLVDEVHQSFVPGRHASVFDWLADTLGATLVAGIHYMVIRHTELKKRAPDDTTADQHCR